MRTQIARRNVGHYTNLYAFANEWVHLCLWLQPAAVGVIFQIQQNFSHLTFAVENETKERPVAQGLLLKKDDFLLWFLSTHFD